MNIIHTHIASLILFTQKEIRVEQRQRKNPSKRCKPPANFYMLFYGWKNGLHCGKRMKLFRIFAVVADKEFFLCLLRISFSARISILYADIEII